MDDHHLWEVSSVARFAAQQVAIHIRDLLFRLQTAVLSVVSLHRFGILQESKELVDVHFTICFHVNKLLFCVFVLVVALW